MRKMTSDSSGVYRQTSAAGYVYDQTSNAVLNTNDGELQAFQAKRQKFKNEQDMKRRIEALELKVLELEAKLERLDEITSKY